jgi:pilus assembly protein CpaF
MMGQRGFQETADTFFSERRQEAAVESGGISVEELTTQVRDQVIQIFPATRIRHPDEEVSQSVRRMAREAVERAAESAFASGSTGLSAPAEQVADQIVGMILGLGPLEDLLRIPGVEDIAICGPEEVWTYKGGGWDRQRLQFTNEAELLTFLNRMIAHTGRSVSPMTPVVDATIRGGHRINIVMSPCAEPSPCATIRVRRRTGFTMEDLVSRDMRKAMIKRSRSPVPDYERIGVEGAMLSPQAAKFLHGCVLAGMNIVVVGGTGVGKTSFLGALGTLIPNHLRIVCIEDTRELNMRPSGNGESQNCVYFTTRAPTLEGTPGVSQADLVRAALRQRPDALTLGEARGGEVLDLLKALCTGHRNGLTSVHAESVGDLVTRLKLMLQEAEMQTKVDDRTVAEWIALAFHIGVALEMGQVATADGVGKVRRVAEIIEFSGVCEGSQPARTKMFEYQEQQGCLVRKGTLSRRGKTMWQGAGLDFQEIVAMDTAGTGRGGY